MPNLSGIETLPPWLQVIVTAAVIVIITLGGRYRYQQTKKRPPTEDVLLPHGMITDMRPAREIAEHLDRLVHVQERTAAALELIGREWEIQNRVRDRERRGGPDR